MDYREYLRYFYLEKKKERKSFSFKSMGAKVGIDSSYLNKVFARQFHISDTSIPALVKFCNFDARESEYFEVLVHFGKARTSNEARAFFDRLVQLSGIQNRVLAESQYQYYQNWYHVAVRSLLGVLDFQGDFADLASRLDPAITVAQAQESIALLERLELVQKGNDGVYRLTESHVTTGKDYRSLAVKHFQKDMLRLAERALEEQPREVRDLSTLTMALRQESLTEIREILRKSREEIQKRVGMDQDVNCVYQPNIQFFPLSRLAHDHGTKSDKPSGPSGA